MLKMKDKKKNIEVLAPAGSYESMIAAFNAGADAVYMGGNRFGARAYADNPGEDQLKRAIDYAHYHHKRLYLTLNTLLKEDELEKEIYSFLNPYYTEGLHGVIIQDFGLFSMLKEAFPGLPLHASTQMTLTAQEMAGVLEAEGMERIVLARELSIDEIRQIRQSTEVELEVFVQGALCYCYSGQCLMSSMIGGRSGNRGRCAQPCRLPYRTEGKNIPSYLLSLKDICTLDDIPELAEAGVDSFKIEGRMKKPEYAAMTAWLYRHYLDRYLEYGREKYKVDTKDIEKLMDLYNRGGFSGGYLHQHNADSMIFTERPNHMGLEVGIVTKKGNIRAMRSIKTGDVLEMRQGGEKIGSQWTVGKEIPSGTLFLPENAREGKNILSAPVGTKIYRMRNQSLINEIHETFVRQELKEKIYGQLRIVKDSSAMLTLKLKDISVTVEGDMVQKAKNRPMAAEQLRRPLLKTGNTPFVFEQLDVETDDESFIPNQQLNELRRKGLEKLGTLWLQSFYRESGKLPEVLAGAEDLSKKIAKTRENFCLHVMLDGQTTLKRGRILAGEKEICRVYAELHEAVKDNFKTVQLFSDSGKEVYFALPGIFREKDRKLLTGYLKMSEELADGYLVRQVESARFVKSVYPKAKIIFDNSIYAMNRRAKACLKKWGADEITAPAELNFSELMKIGCEDMELLVYGHQQLMISAQCIKKIQEGCTKVPKMVQLTDRQHKHFYVYNECEFCYNRIYNGLPTVLLDKKKEVFRLNPASLRIHFTVENESQMMKVLQTFRQIYILGEMPEIQKDLTRGHFNRGVE